MNFATSSEKRSEKPGQELVITTEEENSQRVTVTSTCQNYRYYRVRNIQQLSQCLRREKLPQHWAELAKCVMMGKWQWHCHRPIDCWQNSEFCYRMNANCSVGCFTFSKIITEFQ